ncbi:MAG: RNA polymerase sigma factor SigM [Acidipropionibacterium acidipropionici]|jgi:RNA polymerase sigma-70 factor (ECF subfamily)|uniref:RNA polymerase, sigma subunit, ECF family n=1 Tax=Acidipropionibacterium acidipropionici (strain ATCC 4875 / DSM 20272 / JCM 6432 / NBRC 12425 / NCIMB 8070 / 4) TaxID=1171373 RepID=K7SPF5_ACIA4|nr:RNA polymerase sigma factor SigM [Acidipropionibacterium acidipropionici]AFV91125.1 RNA polymerase, sigma subunit, ECF family [Acidipropionibacterium acidipropionici ATCC 4875]AZP36744.1 RNA polymerase sigma factor SigM [Acidipropionibacterium acidipropionici]QCV96559.1 RNA polymerase sigma factor SigM [Acidipropionibacterium acidipropionici]
MNPRNDARPELSDAELLRAHVEGDPTAFGELFLRHRDRLWAVALRTMRNREDAADALQDAMVSAFRRASSFRGESAVTSWLHRIVVNACLDQIRRSKVRRAEALPDNLDHDPKMVTDEDPAADLVAADLAGAVEEALGRINADQRAALVLVDMEGLSVEEAAAQLGVPKGTIKSRCARGRARLAVLLEPLRGAA